MARALFLSFFISFFSVFPQVGPRVWKDHTSLNWSNSVTRLGSQIYASNGVGVVRFDQDEIAPQSLTKINGLNDIGVKMVRANDYNNKLLVIYDNCNIDVIDINENIKNYADFKLKPFNGKKSVNEVTFYKQMAYIACGFGIVLFDTDKLEIKETFFIGPNATNLEVYQVALNDSIIFAATPNGIYKSNHKTKNLNDFNSWKLDTLILPPGPYAGIVSCKGKIVTAYSPYKTDPSMMLKDTIYLFDNNAWSKLNPSETGYTVKKFCMSTDKYYSYINQFGVIVRDIDTYVPITYITSYRGDPIFDPNDIFFGKNASNNMVYWLSDYMYGLYHTLLYHPYPMENVSSSGLHIPMVSNIDVFNGKVAVAPSHPDEGGQGTYTREGINILKEGEWSYYRFNDSLGTPIKDLKRGNPIQDITNVLLDRKDQTKMWAASWANGLLEYKNNELIAIHNASNSAISELAPNAPRMSGLSMDKDGNLWFSNCDVKNYVGVVKKNGTISTFDFGVPRFTRKLLADRNGNIWAIHEREGGITVYKPGTNFSQPVPGVNYKMLTKDVGSGNIQSNAVFSIAEDNDGKIWVGTAAGVAVFYNPSSIFNSSGFDAQPIKIVQDGNVELLLGKETISSIVVDGANNKWIGTLSGGVYCFSPDGLTQLYHFTEQNSVLYSNYVLAVNYDEVTGDVFIGTDRGLQSFKGTILAGETKYSDVYAYPNPVRPNYGGTVLIHGLIDNSSVKIVDESGNLVWETKSQGGQIEWPITNFSRNRVTPGVYIVYASTLDGGQKAVTKILVIN